MGDMALRRSFDDSDWMMGDELARLSTWDGDPDLGHREAEPVKLAVRMRCAELYTIETCGTCVATMGMPSRTPGSSTKPSLGPTTPPTQAAGSPGRHNSPGTAQMTLSGLDPTLRRRRRRRTMSLEQALLPAIRLARDGFPVGHHFVLMLVSGRPIMTRYPANREPTTPATIRWRWERRWCRAITSARWSSSPAMDPTASTGARWPIA